MNIQVRMTGILIDADIVKILGVLRVHGEFQNTTGRSCLFSCYCK